MEAYDLDPDYATWAALNDMEASHVRGLPGMECPKCSAWAVVGLLYPPVDISRLDSMVELVDVWPVSVEEFGRIAD